MSNFPGGPFPLPGAQGSLLPPAALFGPRPLGTAPPAPIRQMLASTLPTQPGLSLVRDRLTLGQSAEMPSVPLPAQGVQFEAPELVLNLKPDQKYAKVLLYPSYGNESEVRVKGRVTREKPGAQAEAGQLGNLINNLDLLENHELKNSWVDVTFQGKTVSVQTDDEGLFEARIQDFGSVQPGLHSVQACWSAQNPRQYPSVPGVGMLSLQPQHDRTAGIVSDIDDTIQRSDVTHKLSAAKILLLGNYTTQEAVPGMAELYQALDQRSDGQLDGDTTYLSGSPLQLAERIEKFLDYHHFPVGALEFKNMGIGPDKDSPTEQVEYKLKKLRRLFETYPEKPFFLFGDNGEKDPEIYRQIATEFPGRVLGIYIRNVTQDQPTAPRYAGTQLCGNALEMAQDLYAKGHLSSADLETVRQAVH